MYTLRILIMISYKNIKENLISFLQGILNFPYGNFIKK